MSSFYQMAPEIKNPYTQDKFLKSYLSRFLSDAEMQEVDSDLTRFGDRLIGDIAEMADEAEQNPPVLNQFDPWGKRIDEIKTSKGWQQLDRVSAEEKLVALGYQRPYGAASRIVQFTKIMLFHPSSAFYSCPLAMTDGAAKVIEKLDNKELKEHAYQHLTSSDPKKFWTSGQWMTEKTGGSDVGETETIARFENGEWRLYGTKWFTSATTSQMAMALARVEENNETLPGSKGLGLFYIELRDNDKNLNGIKILRLKDKLGTKALPTAELKLDGTLAKMVAPAGEGVKTIASLFNITRIYNACTSIGSMRRLLFLAKDYAHKRKAFGHDLKELPLHAETMAKLELDYQSAFHLAFYVAHLQGLEECPSETPDINKTKTLLRLFTPMAKLVTAKINILATSELVESFGGAGYIENTGIPKFLRDAQVLSIWEGTTNVLSLDLLRALKKEEAFSIFVTELSEKFENFDSEFVHEKKKLKAQLDILSNSIQELKEASDHELQAHARELAFTMAQLMSATLMVEHAQSSQRDIDKLCAQTFCQRELISLKVNMTRNESSRKIAFEDFKN
jgi:alkylation response protein AidB-like acyl-CoA dehydrogenase